MKVEQNNNLEQLISLTVTNDVANIDIVLHSIEAIATRYGLEYKDISKLCLATEEAISNLLSFGFEKGEKTTFDVKVYLSDLDLTISILDKGKPIDFSQLEFSKENTDGLGVHIMCNLVDNVEFILGANGREQRLIKRLESLPEYIQQDSEEEVADMPEQIEFDFRPIRPNETMEVAQCIYNEFGYTYIYETIYYPDKFYEACQRGDVYSLVAVAPNGELVGHLALVMDSNLPGIGEMAMGVVKQKYRKYSVMGRLTSMLVDHAKNKLKLKGMYAQPVAYHTITQHMSNKMGLTACSFAFSYTSAEMQTTINNSMNRKSVASAITAFNDDPKKVYIPSEVSELITDVYTRCQIDREIIKVSQGSAEPLTICKLSSNERMKLAKIHVKAAGDDWSRVLKAHIISAKRSKGEVIELYINLTSPSASYAYEVAKSYDFFCTGVIPIIADGDYMTMQCLLNEVVDYDSLTTIEPFTTLLNNIKKLDPNEQ